jgi:hypothetical protein
VARIELSVKAVVIVDERGAPLAATTAEPAPSLEDEGEIRPIPMEEAPAAEPVAAKGQSVRVVEVPDDFFSLPPDEALDQLASRLEHSEQL